MNLERVTSGVQFNTGISTAEWNTTLAGETTGGTQRSILPGSTTVSEALSSIFPKDPSVSGELMAYLASSGASVALRSSSRFAAAARKTIRSLRAKKGAAAPRAAEELETLLADTELLDHYRAALLET